MIVETLSRYSPNMGGQTVFYNKHPKWFDVPSTVWMARLYGLDITLVIFSCDSNSVTFLASFNPFSDNGLFISSGLYDELACLTK